MRKCKPVQRVSALLIGVMAGGLCFDHSGFAADAGWQGKAEAPQYQERVFPPWSHGKNNPATNKGVDVTVPEVNDLPDFHGSMDNPELVIFVAGNYYFAMAPLIAAFEKQNLDLKGHIYYETLPPGILIKQMKAGGTITVGNATWTVKPDVFAAGAKKVDDLVADKTLAAPSITYASNDLTIMVAAGNPAHIERLQDLAKPGIHLSMPNPAWEGVVRQIKASLMKAGGSSLTKAVYETKVANGETILTHVHHRQTPLYLIQGVADAGVTWQSEAVFQEQVGHPISHIAIPANDNTTAVYGAAMVNGAAHPAAAKAWLTFLKSSTALHIFESYGFKEAPPKKAM